MGSGRHPELFPVGGDNLTVNTCKFPWVLVKASEVKSKQSVLMQDVVVPVLDK